MADKIIRSADTLDIRISEQTSPTNIHNAMKQASRRIYGKVAITYTDPLLQSDDYIEVSSIAHNSSLEQLTDAATSSDKLYFTLYDNDLSGNYYVSDKHSQVGWVSAEVSDENGRFVDNQPYVTLRFDSRPIISMEVAFDASHGNIAKNFTVTFIKENSEEVVETFTNNTEAIVNVIPSESIPDVVAITISISEVTKPNSPAVILDVPMSSTILYTGYEDESNLMSIDLLEELTYEDEIEALGGMSANEVTVVLDNSSRDFFFNSGSIVSNQLKRNRKIVPWLGAEIKPGEIEWHALGTFWSYKWDVPTSGLTASVVGFDTIGLLDLTDYIEHQVQIDKSLGELIEYVLEDAKRRVHFIEYSIDESLYEITIPYAWFERGSHAAALRKISSCYPMHIYCDRQGRICAKPQKLRMDYYYDVWADDTNVIDKTYSSLYTTLPNVVNVTVDNIVAATASELAKDETIRDVYGPQTIVLNFSSPYISDLSINVEYTGTITYSYVAYSWGIIITLDGIGTVNNITCHGVSAVSSNTSIITRRDEDSVRLNGAVTRNIASDFIQTTALANMILDRIFSLSELDKFDATVKYRGDISLTINDPILLQDGIAPDNRYNIKRHELSWNGSLTGSAELNT